jgi:hypothetical protein
MTAISDREISDEGPRVLERLERRTFKRGLIDGVSLPAHAVPLPECCGDYRKCEWGRDCACQPQVSAAMAAGG